MSERIEDPRIVELKERGLDIYSISKLNSFNQCPYQYYKTYIEKDRGANNCYGIAGGIIHDALEDIHNGDMEIDQLKEVYNNMIFELEVTNNDFPTPAIKKNWMADISHFIDTFEKVEIDMLTERLILFELAPDIWIRGYVDVIGVTKDKELVILDWKTSGKFSGEKLVDAGRQLLLYQIALEELTDYKVDKIGWYMIKYVNVKYKGRYKMCSRRDWVKNYKDRIINELVKMGNDHMIAEMMVDQSVSNNNLNNLPKEIQDAFIVEPCYQWYKPTDENIKEVKDYVINTVKSIEECKATNEWEVCNIHKNLFFCENLCSHRKSCEYLKKHIELNGGFQR